MAHRAAHAVLLGAPDRVVRLVKRQETARARVCAGRLRDASTRAAVRLRVPEQLRAPEAAVRDVRASVRVGGSAGGSHTRAGEARAAVLPGVAPRRGSAGGVRLPPAGGRRRTRRRRRRRPRTRRSRRRGLRHLHGAGEVRRARRAHGHAVRALLPQGVPRALDGGQDGVSHV